MIRLITVDKKKTILFFASILIFSSLWAQTDTVRCEQLDAPIDFPDFIESAPALSADGKTMIFVSDKNEGLKLFFTTKDTNNKWKIPEPIAAINQVGNIGSYIDCPFLSYDGSKLYFSANFSQGYGGMDIYVSELTNGKWGEPQNLGAIVNSARDELSPSLPIGEDIVYFCRNNLEAENKAVDCKTIFMARKEGFTWQSPLPLPGIINYGCEETPLISYDNATLYFSSIQTEGTDVYRLYKATKIEDQVWDTPAPLNYGQLKQHSINPIVVFADNYLFYSEKSPDKKIKKENIHRCLLNSDEVPKPMTIIEGKILDGNTKTPLPKASIIVSDNKTSAVIAEVKSRTDGSYRLILPVNKHYKIKVNTPNSTVATKEMLINTDDNNRFITQDFELYNEVTLELEIFNITTDNIQKTDALVSVRGKKSKTIEPIKESNGKLIYSLPLNDDYQIIAKKASYEIYSDSIVLSGAVHQHKYIRNVVLAPLLRNMQVKVIDFSENNALKATVLITATSSKYRQLLNCIPEKGEQANVNLRDDEIFRVEVLPEEGYTFYTRELNLRTEKADIIELRLRKLKEGITFPVVGINFRPGTIDLTEEAIRACNCLLWILQKNPTLQLELTLSSQQNTDSQQSGLQLISIINYLHLQGIDKGRIIPSNNNNSLPNNTNEIELNCTVKSIL